MAKRSLSFLLAAVFLLTACEARFDSSLTVNADESGSFAIELSLDDELREVLEEQGGQQFLGFADQLAEVPPGWQTHEFTEGVFQGVRVSTDFADFAELEARLATFDEQLAGAELSLPDTFRTLGLARDGDVFRFEADLSQMTNGIAALSDQEVGGLDVAQVIDTIFTIRIIVTLPGEILEHNADSIDGSTLVWDIDSADTSGVLRATSDASVGPSPASIIGLVVLVVGLAALLGLVLRRSRRRRAEELDAARLIDRGSL